MKNTFLGAIVVALGLGATVPFVGWAQDQPQTQGQQVRRGRGDRRAWPARRTWRPHGRTDGRRLAFREVMRDLTDAQREQVRVIHERHADRIRPLAERAHAAREAVNNAVLAGNAGQSSGAEHRGRQRRDRADVRAGAGAVGGLQRADGRAEAEDRRAAEGDAGAPL